MDALLGVIDGDRVLAAAWDGAADFCHEKHESTKDTDRQSHTANVCLVFFVPL
jgi:hypothetical protein